MKKSFFQDYNASCRRAKWVKTFLPERKKIFMTWLVNSLDLNPIENLKCKSKKLVHEKALSTKKNLLAAIRESLNYFDKEHWFE